MLESLQQTNIRDLNLEEPVREVSPFDPREDMLTHLDVVQESSLYKDINFGSSRISDEHRALLIFFPNLFNTNMLSFTRLALGLRVFKRAPSASNIRYMNWGNALDQASLIKSFFPETRQTDLMTEGDWKSTKEAVGDIVHSYEYMKLTPNEIDDGEYGGYEGEPYYISWIRRFFRYGGSIQRILPSKVPEFDLNNPKYYKVGKETLEINRKEENWDRFFALAPDLKAVFPERREDFNLTQDDWESVRKFYLDYSSKKDIHLLLKFAGQILDYISEEIRFLPDGVEILMPKRQPEIIQEITPIPETRKF